MNKTVKYVLIYAVVAGGAYYIYQKYKANNNKLTWDMIKKF